MTEGLVKQSIAELQDLVRCRCRDAYKVRGLHDPGCECDSADAVQVVADRIEELEAKQQETFQMYVDANEARIDAEAKLSESEDLLAKAQGALHQIAGKKDYADDPWGIARTTLAELTGGKDAKSNL